MIDVGRLNAGRLRSLLSTAPASVVAATIAAKLKSYAKPHVRRCGFMTLSQTQIITPICGRQRMNGTEPKTNNVIATSLTLVVSSNPAARGLRYHLGGRQHTDCPSRKARCT